MSKKYFNWLKEKVDFLDFPETYDRLFQALQEKFFIWKHPMDKNRALDAISLRDEYCRDTGLRSLSNTIPPTVLEFLISISRSMNYICASFDEDKTKIIFWRLLSNLDLSKMSDPNYDSFGGDGRVDEVLDIFLNRKYQTDGQGGLFPMANPRQNQKEVEIWYQMNQYLSDPNGEDLKSY